MPKKLENHVNVSDGNNDLHKVFFSQYRKWKLE